MPEPVASQMKAGETGDREILFAADIETRLREARVPALLIPGIIGAAFMASLTNLPLPQRRRVIVAHLEAVQAIAADIQHARQAPDGPMASLRNIRPRRRTRDR